MNSISGIVSVHGSRFDSGVVRAGDATEQPVNENLELPGGSRVGLLAALPVAKDPADREELKDLMGEAFAVDERIKKFAQARFAEQHAHLDLALEQAKGDVLAQDDVLVKLNEKFAADQQEWVRVRNVALKAQYEEHAEEQLLKSLSPFCSRKDRDAAEKRLESAKAKREKAEREAAEHHSALNFLQMVTIVAAREKRRLLVDAAKEAEALLSGRDPHMATLGIMQR